MEKMLTFKDFIVADYTQHPEEKDPTGHLAKRARDRKNGRIDESFVVYNTKTTSVKKRFQTLAAAKKAAEKLGPEYKTASATFWHDNINVKNVKEDLDEEKDPCWKGYKQYGTKEKDGKKVPNCIPEDTSSDREEGTDSLLKKYKSETPGEEVDEALNMAQRMKARQVFKRNKAKIAIGRKKAEKKFASPEKLKLRARKAARKTVEKMILKQKTKDELSYGQRQELEKKVDKKTAVINRLAKKLLPQVRKAEKERKMNKGKSK